MSRPIPLVPRRLTVNLPPKSKRVLKCSRASSVDWKVLWDTVSGRIGNLLQTEPAIASLLIAGIARLLRDTMTHPKFAIRKELPPAIDKLQRLVIHPDRFARILRALDDELAGVGEDDRYPRIADDQEDRHA